MASLTETNCRICFVLCDESAIKASEIVETYYEVTGYEIFPSDVPQKVCTECHDQLLIVKEFRGICEASEKFLEEQRKRVSPVFPTLDDKVENDEPIEKSDNEVDYDESVRRSKRQKKLRKLKPSAIRLGPLETSLTFEEYEELEEAYKSRRKEMKQVARLKKAEEEQLKNNVQSTNMDNFLTKAPLRKPKQNPFVNWDYHLLQQYLKQRKIIMSGSLSFAINFDVNHLSPDLLRINEDTTDYPEIKIQNNILSCTFCSYTVGQTETSPDILMQRHCNTSHTNSFKCFRFNCSVSFPCLDLVRRHNAIAHQKPLVLIRPLQCNFCQFSCCFETNMANHFKKMHSERLLVTCEHCQAKFYCDDLKLQHIAFQCRQGISPDLASILEASFKKILKRDELEEGEIARNPKQEYIDVQSEMEPDEYTKSEPTLNDLLGIKYSCDYCFYSTRYFTKLEHHMTICRRATMISTPNLAQIDQHSPDEIPYKNRVVFCEICATEIRVCRLKVHMNAHKNVRFQCALCEKNYRKKVDLRNHIEISHLNMKIHVCSYCGKSFSHYSVLLRHTKQNHTGMDHVCDLCGKKYVTRSAMEYHRHSHTGKEKIREINVRTSSF